MMIKITFDTNCFFEYYERNPVWVEELIEFQKRGLVEIAMTTRVRTDTEDKKQEDTSEIWERIQTFPITEIIGTAFRIGKSRLGSGDYIISEDDKLIFEALHKIMVGAQVEDIDHIFGHLKANHDIFVTNDKHFLNHRAKLKQEFGIVVLNLQDVIKLIKQKYGRQLWTKKSRLSC